MKIQSLIVGMTICTLCSFAQESIVDIKSIQKNMVPVGESLYACKYEVTNREYNQFLSDLKDNNSHEIYIKALIDSAQWSSSLTYNEPYINYYHTHPAYSDYPVVNISHIGAELFCTWLTDQYNASTKKKFGRVQFRLPTEEEWMTAGAGGNDGAIYPWEGNATQNKKGTYLANFKMGQGDYMGIAGNLNENADVTAPVESYFPNGFGLYNMGGNVSEMLASKGKTKGGSWLDSEDALHIESDGHFNGPLANVGFRYFMEVLER